MKKELDFKPISIKNFLKIKIKSQGDGPTIFHNEIHAVGSNYTCLAVTSIDFVLKNDDKFYTQVFVKEYKYIENEKR